jgi:hypothetical protein
VDQVFKQASADSTPFDQIEDNILAGDIDEDELMIHGLKEENLLEQDQG